jgi:hypothetical protein
VIQALGIETYTAWCWVDGYQLNTQGEAIERRSLFVQIAGLRGMVDIHAVAERR